MISRHMFPTPPTEDCCGSHVSWHRSYLLMTRTSSTTPGGQEECYNCEEWHTCGPDIYQQVCNVYRRSNENSLSAPDNASWFAWAIGARSNIRHIMLIFVIIDTVRTSHTCENIQFHLLVMQQPVSLSRKYTSFKTATRVIFCRASWTE